MWHKALMALLFGLVEGVSEWLPISSTGHLILVEHFLDFGVSDEFFELFEVVIQLAAMLAVGVLFWGRLNPFSRRKSRAERRGTLSLWGLCLLATLPSAVVGLILDDWLDAHLYRASVVALTLILYGAVFILIERRRSREALILETEAITPRTALLIGCFQLLALIPGTSRSGATILGGIALGLARPAAAEFSFFLGIPTMLGAGLLKGAKFCLSGNRLSAEEGVLLALASLAAFAVSLFAIRFLMDFVRRHSFVAFGVYRILLGTAVLIVTLL